MGTEKEAESLASAHLREHLRKEESQASEHSAEFVDGDVMRAVTFLESLDVGFEETRLHDVITYDQASRTVKDAVTHGNVSEMQHMRGFVDPNEGTEKGLSKLMPYLKQEACIIAIVGPPNSGKTNAALYLADEWSKSLGAPWGTNVPIRGGWEEMFPVLETESAVKDWMSDQDQRAMFVADEYGTEGGSSSGSDPHASEAFTQFARGIRKDPYNGNLILIGHRDNDINAAMRDLVTVVLEKRDQMNKPETYVWTDGFSNFERGGSGWDFVMDVPETRIGYADQNPVFEFGDRDDQETGVVELSKEERVWTAQCLRNNDMTVREIADNIDRSRTWVSDHTEKDLDADDAVAEYA